MSLLGLPSTLYAPPHLEMWVDPTTLVVVNCPHWVKPGWGWQPRLYQLHAPNDATTSHTCSHPLAHPLIPARTPTHTHLHTCSHTCIGSGQPAESTTTNVNAAYTCRSHVIASFQSPPATPAIAVLDTGDEIAGTVIDDKRPWVGGDVDAQRMGIVTEAARRCGGEQL